MAFDTILSMPGVSPEGRGLGTSPSSAHHQTNDLQEVSVGLGVWGPCLDPHSLGLVLPEPQCPAPSLTATCSFQTQGPSLAWRQLQTLE